MGEGVGAGLLLQSHAAGLSEGVTSLDLTQVEQRVCRYLAALGVHRTDEVAALCRQARARIELRAAVGQLGEPLEGAIEEVHLLLDQWLVAELGVEGDADSLSAARAVVLSGHLPGWTRRWAGLSDESLAEAIRSAMVGAVPARAPLGMEPSSIQLCCHRAGLRLLARLGRLLGIRGKRREPSGERS